MMGEGRSALGTEDVAALAERARGGDRVAFERIVAQFHPRLWLYFLRLLGNEHDAEDAVQETFFRAWRRVRELRRPAAFEGWLMRIARNVAIDVRRRRSARPQQSLEHTHGEATAVSSTTPEDSARRRELEKRVATFLGGLTAEQRDVFLLRLHTDLTFREIATILDEPLTTVVSRMHAALGRLRDLLEQDR